MRPRVQSPFRGQTDRGLWAKSLLIFNAFCDHAKQSIRQVAHQTGLSTSSVHRLTQAMERRAHHPESWWWDTDEGRCGCIRLVVATLSIFGLTRGVGAETSSEFFGHRHLETHVGCAPSALRGVMHALEHVLLETAAAWEHEGRAESEGRPIIGAVDATFLERMLLVCMALGSGSLLLEEVAEERRSDTWHALVEARLAALGAGVLSLVSDRAKALITLAETGLECRSVPDVFPLIHALVQSSALAMCRRLRQARQAVRQAQELRRQCQASHRSGAEVQQVQAVVEASAAEVTHWESVHSAYRHHLETVSLLVHPWRRVDSTRQTSAEVARQWHAETQAIEA
jgi:IclR helix-turn-helix domain